MFEDDSENKKMTALESFTHAYAQGATGFHSDSKKLH